MAPMVAAPTPALPAAEATSAALGRSASATRPLCANDSGMKRVEPPPAAYSGDCMAPSRRGRVAWQGAAPPAAARAPRARAGRSRPRCQPRVRDTEGRASLKQRHNLKPPPAAQRNTPRSVIRRSSCVLHADELDVEEQRLVDETLVLQHKVQRALP